MKFFKLGLGIFKHIPIRRQTGYVVLYGVPGNSQKSGRPTAVMARLPALTLNSSLNATFDSAARLQDRDLDSLILPRPHLFLPRATISKKPKVLLTAVC